MRRGLAPKQTAPNPQSNRARVPVLGVLVFLPLCFGEASERRPLYRESAKTAGRSLPGVPYCLSSALGGRTQALIPGTSEFDVRAPTPRSRQVGLAFGLHQIEKAIPQPLNLAPQRGRVQRLVAGLQLLALLRLQHPRGQHSLVRRFGLPV